MISKFRDVDKAIAHLCGELGLRAHGKYADVTWYSSEQTQERNAMVPPAQLSETLERFSRQFPEATVILEPDGGGVPVAGLQCRCNHMHRKACPYQCKHHNERPIICVLLCPPESPPSEQTKQDILRQFFDSMHAYQVAYKEEHIAEYRGKKKRRSSHHSHRSSRSSHHSSHRGQTTKGPLGILSRR